MLSKAKSKSSSISNKDVLRKNGYPSSFYKAVVCRPLKPSSSIWQTCHQIIISYQEAVCRCTAASLGSIANGRTLSFQHAHTASSSICMWAYIIEQSTTNLNLQLNHINLNLSSWLMFAKWNPEWEILYSEVMKASNYLQEDPLYLEAEIQ